METKTLTSRDDLGFVDRVDEATACEGGNGVYCQIIDDASVYYRVIPQGEQENIYQQATEDSTEFPGMPTGRIPAFYRALVAQRRFLNLAGRKPKVGELVRILSVVDGAARNAARVDDAWTTNALIRGLLGLPLSESEQSFIAAQAGGGTGSGSGSSYYQNNQTASTGGGMGTVGIVVGVAIVAGVLAFMGRK